MSDFVEVDFDHCIQETESAVLLQLDEDNAKWIPRSVIEEGEVPEQGDENSTTFVATWFAEKEGLC